MTKKKNKRSSVAECGSKRPEVQQPSPLLLGLRGRGFRSAHNTPDGDLTWSPPFPNLLHKSLCLLFFKGHTNKDGSPKIHAI